MKVKLFGAIVAAALSVLAFSATAQASYSHYNICWVTANGVLGLPGGTTDCHYLPSNYHISGVRKPYCNRRDRCRYSKVRTRLTRRKIRSLSRYMDTSSMLPGAYAWVYAKARY